MQEERAEVRLIASILIRNKLRKGEWKKLSDDAKRIAREALYRQLEIGPIAPNSDSVSNLVALICSSELELGSVNEFELILNGLESTANDRYAASLLSVLFCLAEEDSPQVSRSSLCECLG